MEYTSKILPAKSRARRRRPGHAQSGRTPEFGYGPLTLRSLVDQLDTMWCGFAFTAIGNIERWECKGIEELNILKEHNWVQVSQLFLSKI